MKTCIEEISSKRAVMKETKKKGMLESKTDLSLVDFMSSCTLKI